MPKRVDAGQRRAEIAALVVDVIQREGAASATVRRVSEEGGFSIGVITHYFRDKDELIACAFDWLAERSFAELDTTLAQAGPGLARLRAALEFMVPRQGESSFPAVWLSLWSGAMHNPGLADVHRRYYSRWRRILGQCMTEAARRGDRRPGAGGAVRRWKVQRAATSPARVAADDVGRQAGRFCRSSARTRAYSRPKASVNDRGISSVPAVCWVSKR